MPISITCQCGKKLKAPDKLAGKSVKCPACQHLLTVPESLEVIEDEIVGYPTVGLVNGYIHLPATFTPGRKVGATIS